MPCVVNLLAFVDSPDVFRSLLPGVLFLVLASSLSPLPVGAARSLQGVLSVTFLTTLHKCGLWALFISVKCMGDSVAKAVVL